MVSGGFGEQAGHGRRLGAFMIDGVASDLVALAFTRPPGQGYTAAVLITFAVERVVLTALTGCSVGQRVLGIAVRRLDGKPVGFARATIRTLLLILLVPVFLVDRDGRGLHDRAAGTVLVHQRQR